MLCIVSYTCADVLTVVQFLCLSLTMCDRDNMFFGIPTGCACSVRPLSVCCLGFLSVDVIALQSALSGGISTRNISQLPNLCSAQAQGHVLIADWSLPIDVMNINKY